MAMPRSVVKIKKNNVEFISNVDRANHTMRELVMRANYDVARLLIRRMRQEARKSPSMKRLPKRRFNSTFQYWVRKIDKDLLVGIKANTWYGVEGELGTNNQPKRGILRNTTFNHIADIRRIQGAYLSAIEDENRAMGLISTSVPDGITTEGVGDG